MKKIFIFGTGAGYLKMRNMFCVDNHEILGFIDNNEDKHNTIFEGYKVFLPNEAVTYDFDFIVIASNFYDEIYNQLVGLGVQKEKIIKYYSIDDNIFDNRIASLKLISNEINEKKLEGNVAELGVYRGDFAKYINKFFPDKKLYLFDTFEGFDERDIKVEYNNKFSTASKGDFKDTNEDLVLNKMLFKNNCIIKKGYFPESLNGLEDKFVFVSLDVDLFKPTYDGLNYFYDRLVHGGYIFIHDYNNISYGGAKEAVRKFCNEKNINYFPMNDTSGSAVILK